MSRSLAPLLFGVLCLCSCKPAKKTPEVDHPTTPPPTPTGVQTGPTAGKGRPSPPAPAKSNQDEKAVQALKDLGAELQSAPDGKVMMVSLENKNASDSVADLLKKLPYIQVLDLGYNPITDAFLEALQGSCPELTQLTLSGTKVTDKVMTIIAKAAPRLEACDLTACQGITDQGMAPLAHSPLVQLHLTGTRVTDAGLAHLKDMKSLQELYCGNPGVTDAGLQHVKSMTGLKSLAIGNTRISDAGLAQLKDMAQLEFLVLDGTTVSDAGLNHIKGLRNLKRLRLASTRVTPAGEAALKMAIPGLAVER